MNNILVQNEKFALEHQSDAPLGPSMKLYRLVAQRDIGNDVKKGDRGGLVTGPMNLSDTGECWIYPDAIVYAGARVMDDSTVRQRSRLSGDVRMRGNSMVSGSVNLMGHFELVGNDCLEGCTTLIVNMDTIRMGQYVLRGQTLFVPEFRLSEHNTSSLTLGAESCSQQLAASLACRQAGDRVSLVQVGTSDTQQLATTSDGLVPFEHLQQVLSNLRGY